jgi:DNA-binding transcriptional regulator YhcF (GntR family)
MIQPTVDPNSPIPLYHQIAESIRARIADGELAAGDALEPLREAARIWGVNLHTVRHAYTALAREGLVKSRGAAGTRVTSGPDSRGEARAPDTPAFLDRILREAREDHGLNAHQLSTEIARYGEAAVPRRPEVYVVECSVGQCLAHVDEIEARYDVDAREWSLERNQEPPPGCIIATYFHYNDIRRLWPHRLREVRFVTIVPDRGILDRLPAGAERILVCDRDQATAETVAADLSVLLLPDGYDVEPLVSSDPVSEAIRTGDDSVVLAAPRIWFGLGESTRSHDRVMAADYVIDADELTALARELGWREVTTRKRAGTHKTTR